MLHVLVTIIDPRLISTLTEFFFNFNPRHTGRNIIRTPNPKPKQKINALNLTTNHISLFYNPGELKPGANIHVFTTQQCKCRSGIG